MRKMLVLVGMLVTTMIAHGQSTETIFTIQDTKDGEQVIDVQYEAKALEFEMDGFIQADQNGDDCVDRAEAREKGIVDFDRFALSNARCLNEEEYSRALQE